MALLDRILDKFFKRSPKRNKDTGTALQRYWKSFNHALDGILYAFKYEHNMIIIFIATIFAITLGACLKLDLYEWLFILFTCGAIAACEMINSSIEATIDLITTEQHPLAKIAKDTASSATLILCIVAFIGGILIFLPKILELL
ncbi:MAG: diacylglycerol kinase family protein [Bacilli bacterium]|nr:diacylglycerol kinase family protein [Bacilli bacterium]